jgi:hypothetical protein
MLSCKVYCECGIVGNRSRMATEMTRISLWEQKIGNADWTTNCGAIARLMTRRGTKQKSDGPDGPQLAGSSLTGADESPTGTRGKRLAFPPQDPIKKRQNETDEVSRVGLGICGHFARSGFATGSPNKVLIVELDITSLSRDQRNPSSALLGAPPTTHVAVVFELLLCNIATYEKKVKSGGESGRMETQTCCFGNG